MPALNRFAAGALILALGAPTAMLGQTSAETAPDAIDLEDWSYEPLYAEGWLAGRVLDAPVRDADGKEVGTAQDLLVSPDGQLLAVVAEVGGVLDIGDEEVTVPWDEVEMDENGLTLPIAEDVYDNQALLSDAEDGRRQDAWRVTDVLDNHAIFAEGESYGVVLDFVFDGAGTLLATVVGPSSGEGYAGIYAVPFRGLEPEVGRDEAVYAAPATLDAVTALGTFDPAQVGGVASAESE